jgi:HAD superfamily phosphoserine phosphatase-like hydrolase
MPRPRFATVVFDADSTLAAIEGIDWLAARRGPDAAAHVARLTERAMTGGLALEDVYEARLRLIAPTRAEVHALADAYVATVVPGIAALVGALHAAGCEVHVVSGGLHDALVPLALRLGVPERRLHAVRVRFDGDGVVSALDGDQPLARHDGKVRVVERLGAPRPLAMVGDGATDAVVRTVAESFIAFTAVTHRDAVVARADAVAPDAAALRALLLAS